MYLDPASRTRSPSSRQKGIRSSESIVTKPGTMRPRTSTPVHDEMIAPTPPRAKRSSQLMRACDPRPS